MRLLSPMERRLSSCSSRGSSRLLNLSTHRTNLHFSRQNYMSFVAPIFRRWCLSKAVVEPSNSQTLTVVNKSDLPAMLCEEKFPPLTIAEAAVFSVSAVTGAGCERLAEELALPLVIGTEMNRFGQKVVDDFDAEHLHVIDQQRLCTCVCAS